MFLYANKHFTCYAVTEDWRVAAASLLCGQQKVANLLQSSVIRIYLTATADVQQDVSKLCEVKSYLVFVPLMQ